MSITIAIVEDLDVVRNGLKDFISINTDFVVIGTYKTGEEALVELPQIAPDIVIMDINLPGIDGLEATRRIRASELDGDIPIIAITSFAMYGDRAKVLEAGCTAYFEKPIDPLTIVDSIHEAIGVKCE